jgi:hypothetical protein
MTDRLFKVTPLLKTFITCPLVEATITNNFLDYNKYILCVKKKTTQYIEV